MLEPQDIQKLMEVLATKDDIRRLEDKLSAVEDVMHNLVNATDGLVARVEMMHHEFLVLKERDTRYERWFKEIADKIGVTLVP